MTITMQRIVKCLLLATIFFFAIQTNLFAQTQTMDEAMRLKKEQQLAPAAEIFKAIAVREPENVEALSQLATVEGWLQRYNDSIATWQRALALQPDNAEFHTGLARVLFWKGDLSRAEAEVNAALSTHPYDLDALALMGDVKLARGQNRQARAYYLKAQEQNPDSADLKRKLVNALSPLRWRIDLGFGSDNYDNLRGHEAGTYLQIGYKPNHLTDLWVQHQYLHHFSRVDNSIEFGGARRFSKSFVANANVAFTPHNDFEPNWRTHFGGDYQTLSWLAFTGDIKILAYDPGKVQTYMPGIRVRVRPWAEFSFRDGVSHNLDQTITTNWLLRGDFQLREGLALYTGYSRGVEDIPPLRSAFNEVYFTGVVWNASRHWGFRMDWAYEYRPAFYRRLSVSPGLSYRF